jgi:glycosyltransferase involved in cell wall biosynthesis
MGLFGILAKSINKGKLILTFYGVEFVLTGKVPFGNLILKLIIKFADKVTAISTYTKSLVRKEYNVPVSVIPYTSSFSIDSIIDKSKRGDKEKKVKTVLFVGRLIERKGVKYLISAMPKVLDKINARLEIVGSGPLSEELKRLIVKLRLEKNVNLRGRVDDQALADLYRKCDVFVLPSIKDKWGDTEGLGVVLLEAMGFKKPVIASEIGGITDIVKHGQTGLLVKQKNVEGLADAIVKILQDNKLSLTLAENGLSYLKNNFSWKETIRKTKELYE